MKTTTWNLIHIHAVLLSHLSNALLGSRGQKRHSKHFGIFMWFGMGRQSEIYMITAPPFPTSLCGCMHWAIFVTTHPHALTRVFPPKAISMRLMIGLHLLFIYLFVHTLKILDRNDAAFRIFLFFCCCCQLEQ